MTALSSKLISQQKAFFARMVVDAVMMLDDLLQLKMIGIKKVQGGALEVSLPQPPGRLLPSRGLCRRVGAGGEHTVQVLRECVLGWKSD